MAIADIKKSTEQKMQKSLETLKTDLAKVRTGRAHTGLLDHIHVDYYGSPTALSQVANVTLVDARTIGYFLPSSVLVRTMIQNHLPVQRF